MANDALFHLLLRLADDHLVLAHRISEWCGHAPILEEDLALPNIALDMLGQARSLYQYAGEREGAGRDEDALAYLRLENEYVNLLLLERENGDFAHTMLRLFFFSTFMELQWEALQSSSDSRLAEIAAKSVKEARYHFRHSAEWVIRLADGTEESLARMNDAHEELAPYCAEMFEEDDLAREMADEGVAPSPASYRERWAERVNGVFAQAGWEREAPLDGHQSGGRAGRHGEDMGYLLAELQYLQRTYPGLEW